MVNDVASEDEDDLRLWLGWGCGCDGDAGGDMNEVVTKQPGELDGSGSAAEMLPTAGVTGVGSGGQSNEWRNEHKGNCLKGASERTDGSRPWDALVALRLRVERGCGCGNGDASDGDGVGDLESDKVDGAQGIDGNCEFGDGLVSEIIVGDLVVLLGWGTNESAINVAEGCGDAEGCCGRSSEQIDDKGY